MHSKETANTKIENKKTVTDLIKMDKNNKQGNAWDSTQLTNHQQLRKFNYHGVL